VVVVGAGAGFEVTLGGTGWAGGAEQAPSRTMIAAMSRARTGPSLTGGP
jgi:hypothetical protein